MAKERLDVLVVQQGLAESREQARRLVMAGQIRLDGQPLTKAGHRFSDDIQLTVDRPARFVSRGGEKLEGAFEVFGIQVDGAVCLDVGASTGGFTDCLLQHGAAKVYAVDVGKGQLHWKMRNHEQVVCLEGVNARYLTGAQIPEQCSFCCMDVSFISLTKVLPAVITVLTDSAELLTLIKPQFEAGREQVAKGGVVKDPAVRREVVERIRHFAETELGLKCLGVEPSPLLGPAGNVEFLAWWRKEKMWE